MASDTLLLSFLDFAGFPEVNKNTNFDTKVAPYIKQAQISDLKAALGQELYYDLLNDFDSSPSLIKYNELFNGSSYEKNGINYTHEGLKSVLVYFTLSKINLDRNSNDTAFGNVTKTTPYSESVSESVVSRQVGNRKSMALAYLEDVIKFLNDNKQDYPLWKPCDSKVKKSFKISSVG